ncbi:hypothetical protein PJK45_03505 [Mycobacterium kansasii]|uniref:Uncharacterized protein n=4 Tax=Mycobacterium kansasii TaxID=1768 RepID=A0A653EQY3_MYCKA|nr:hypothetical protein [Mycobacterium kansasii]EUA05251.1 hypothetical protein I547_2791 [Mycobacterium kansasii 824]AGZ51297.1 hypothetical protein MKAN_14255 [Mycobacterium kansasii ATCC 12478]EUA12423.1 hypothetical protein I545_5078 [Mycobacterium kansasii 662]KEP38910.1 hypothetical protein MKSMC1_58950 [Mycobacterium kansasii]UCA21841.1 hypothetical protein LA359_11530 [Mycobacterium kansasii]
MGSEPNPPVGSRPDDDQNEPAGRREDGQPAPEDEPAGAAERSDEARPVAENEPVAATGSDETPRAPDVESAGDAPVRRRAGGSIQYQDAETTRPRPPTPAELRARRKYEDKQRELEEARREAEAKRAKQKRVLMGAAAAVGVVGLVAGLGYWLLTPEHVTAQCVQDDPNGQPVIVPDSYCTGHTAGLNGFFFYGGHQYRYYYGSSGTVGQRPSGGTTVAPKGATITTKSGTTISRGGLGGSGGKGGGGSSGS